MLSGGTKIVNAVKRLIQSKAIKNGIWLYALQMFNSVLPLLTLPYVVRLMLPEEYGIFSEALNYVGYIVVVVEYGFSMSGARKIAVSQDSSGDSRIFTIIMFVRGLLCCLCSLLVFVYCIVDNFSLMSLCILALMPMSLGTVLDQTWFFHGKQDMKYIAIINIVARSISTVLIFLCVKDSSDLVVYCVLYGAVTLISGLIGTVIVCVKFGVRLQHITWTTCREEVTEGWYLFISSFSNKVLSSLGITFLGLIATSYDSGIYAALNKIPNILLLVWNPINQVLYPITSTRMLESYQAGSKFVRKMQWIFLAFFVAVCAAIGLFAESIVGLLLGGDYVSHYAIVYPLLGWVLVAIYNNFQGVHMLLAAGYVKEYSSCIRLSAVVAAVGNVVGIYFWGAYGAAYAPLISELVLTVLLYYKRKYVLKTMT